MHRAPTPSGDLETWELDSVQREVAAFLRTHRFRWSDAGDLVQECLITWLERRPTFDAGRSSPMTYLKVVVRSRLKDLLRAELAAGQRAHREAASLDRPSSADDDDSPPLRVPDPGLNPADEAVANLSIERAGARLSSRQRAVLQGLRDDYRVTRLADVLGVHRDTLYADLHRIREAFRREGFGPEADPTDRSPRS